YNTDTPAMLPVSQYIACYPEEFSLIASYPADYASDYNNYNNNYENYYHVKISEPEDISTHYIVGYVKAELTVDDYYKSAQQYTALAYRYRYAIPVMTVLAFLLCITCFLFAVSSAGYHTNQEEPSGTIFEKIPYDLFTVCLVCAGIFGLLVMDECTGWEQIILIAAGLMFLSFILLWFCMSTATRIRTKTILTNNVLYKMFALIRKLSRNLTGRVRNRTRHAPKLLEYLPFVWKAGIFAVGTFLLDFFAVVLIEEREGFGWFLKIMMWADGIAGTILVVYQLHLLESGGQNLADGKLEEKINTKRLFGVFRKHAENLNSISDGMNKAVSDRLKSEMFKTELIANVSHDIRTPLTSIINYTDLLSKLNIQDEKAAEYIGVLTKQSARLRKLTEDVLEASKATAGTTKTQKEIMDMKVLLEQLIGEYSERFEQKDLQLVSNITEHSLTVLGDGRLLWRAVDNLFGNICKYAMPHTRVYLNAYSENHRIFITLRNISNTELNISSDALMERFIRGDRSRNTEGSGLGLSIAQSFINLHNGELNLHIDGDLFKVSIDLPEQEQQNIGIMEVGC
ncbi:MAG: HAMP domain-containing histidine kinase, partial [Oscillospiraceae bacterium]|nr:HAMP domain-containing histidine kinase [Oscillospiraceae bacterium]